MNRKQIKDKSNAGGSAMSGGGNYQARVTTIAFIHLLRGSKLSWLEDIADDIPVSICAETGGSGDDVSVILKTGELVEIQVKKGLKSGPALWGSLMKLATAINNDEINYGILIVSPSSSITIKEKLSKDIIRLGDGRNDNLSNKGIEFATKLNEINLPITKCCKNLRIQTVNAVSGNNSDIKSAKNELVNICDENTNIDIVWDTLYSDASYLIEVRGRRELSSLHRVLKAKSILLKSDVKNSAVSLLDAITKWTINVYNHFSIIGINKKLSITNTWLPIKISKSTIDEKEKFENVDKAILNYQSYGQQLNTNDLTYINPETLAKFKTKTILIGGPGMGKTTLLKRIACSYSNDSIPVLNVRLSMIATKMQNGSSFEDALFTLGLDGSSISQSDIKAFKITKWLILCDGLDECGNMSQQVSEGIERFSQGYQESRFIVTTRPIGYYESLFSDWSYYQIAPLESKFLTKNLSTLIAAGSNSQKQQNDSDKISKIILKNDLIKSLIGRSPLMLGFAASIIINGEEIAETKTKLYQQIFDLIQKVSNNRSISDQVDSIISNRFIKILGWNVTLNPLNNKSEILKLCSNVIAEETNNTELKAFSDSSDYLQYWVNVGLVEKITYKNDEFIVFIHKSFGEFSAAEYLASMSSKDQIENIKKFVNEPKWFEVINFYAQLGYSDLVFQKLITSEAITKKKVEKICLALEIINELKYTTNTELRNDVFREALTVIISEYREYAVDVGKKIIKLALVFSDDLGTISSQYLGSENKWTKLIMWHIVINCGLKYYNIEDLAEFLQSSKQISEPTLISSENGGLIFNSYKERELQQSFTIKSSEVIYDSNQHNYDSIILDALNNTDLHTVSFIDEVNKLPVVIDKKWVIGSKEYYENDYLNWNTVMDKARIPEFIRYKVIFEALGVDEGNLADVKKPKTLLHLSAFLVSSKYWKMPFTDVWKWNSDFDRSATIETIKSIAKICNVDYNKLQEEAQIALSFLSANEENRLSNILTKVDPPDFDWSSASEIEVDKEKIAAALYHPSEWIIYLAANLMDNILDESELEQLIKRLFNDGKGHTLWAASALTCNLPKSIALNLIIDRLNKPLNSGCKYLFIALKKIDFIENKNQLLTILKIGLYDSSHIAYEAASLALDKYYKGQKFNKLISDALSYWENNKKLEPSENRTIPPNPRKPLLKCLIKIKELSYSELISLMKDPDYSINEIARDQLKLLLEQNTNKVKQVLEDLLNGEITIFSISKIFKSEINYNFKNHELKIIDKLLSHENSTIRSELMHLLRNKYLPNKYVITHLEKLTKDENQNIRDRALELIESFNV